MFKSTIKVVLGAIVESVMVILASVLAFTTPSVIVSVKFVPIGRGFSGFKFS